MILAIDPGVHVVAWAALHGPRNCSPEQVKLVACGLLRPKTATEASRLARDLDYEILRKLRNSNGFPLGSPVIVIEEPQSYTQRSKQKGPQDDLIAVALIGGIVVGAFDAAEIYTVKPREWKGQQPKHVTKHRVEKRLSSAEQKILYAVKPPYLLHNAIDAIAIGLSWAGR